MYCAAEESIGNCPVCRKVFHTEDFKHVLDLAGPHSSSLVCSLGFGLYDNINKYNNIVVGPVLENTRINVAMS